jgi:hypothetical protein
MAHIFDIPKNTLEARMKSMAGNFGLLKKMITQKNTLDELRRCGGVGEHARPSKILMYSIADFMIALVGKIRKEDAVEFKRLSVAACKGKLYRKVDDQGDDQGGQDGGDSNDEGYLEQLAEVSNAYGSAGALFSPVRGIPGCNSPIILDHRPPGRPSGRSTSLPGHRRQGPSLPSTSIVLYQSPAPAMVPSTLLRPSARTSTFPTELPTIQLHLSQMKERYGMTQMRQLANRVRFGEEEDTSSDGMLGVGLLSKGQQHGKMRVSAKEQKLLAEKNKKQRTAGSSGASNGLASSLAFTPVQGIELVNPSQRQDSKEGTETYFSKAAAFFAN